MPSYVLPQVLVFQEFTNQPAALVQPLRACIVGEQFELHRYGNADEKAGAKVSSTYDPLNETCFGWPGRTAGCVVDETFTKVFFDNALLKYFNDPIGSGSIIRHVGPGKNRIRAESLIFQTANGFSRSGAFLRDVKIGDAIKVTGNACGSPVSVLSLVLGLVADILPSIVDPATADVSNQTATSASATGSQTAGDINRVTVGAVDGSTYDGLADGNPSEVYTVEVIGQGGLNTAILRVTSQSGNDDQGLVVYDVAFGAPFSIGTRGLTSVFDLASSSSSASFGPLPGPEDDSIFLIGQKFTFPVSQLYVPPTPASSGAYQGPADTTYVATVTRGGLFASSTKPQITVSTTTGIDISGPTDVSASATPVVVGTQNVFIDFTGAGLCKNDRFLVPVIAAKAGPVRTLVLANNLPEGLVGECSVGPSSSSSLSSSTVPPDLDVTLYIKKNMEVPEKSGLSTVNWIQSETEICIESGIVGYDAEWESGGTLLPLPVEDAIIYANYRCRVTTNCEIVGTIDDIGLVALTLGKVDPDNPLAFGVFKALENANGEEVKYISVCSHSPVTLEDWLFALEQLVGRDDVYSLVPLTQDKDVLDAFVAHCEAQSTPENGRWRICWLNLAAAQVVAVVTTSASDPDQPILATITDDPDTSGTQNTIVEAPGETFITSGVRAGDTVRALYTTDGFGNVTYSEFIVDEVQNEETIRLLSGPSLPVNVPSKIEIWRTLTKTELSENLATKPGLFHSRRAFLVWPDQIGNAGVTFPGYFLCSALAGLRSGVLPHQGLTNVEILGFDDVTRTTEYFSANQLNTMAASGYWIVTQDPNDGTVFTRHQLSTGIQTQVNQREQSITTNLDEISYVFLSGLKQFIGRGNVTPTMIDIVQGEILSIIANFKNTIINDQLGPQITEAVILELRQHPTFSDRILCRIQLTLPPPLNNIELHLIV